MVDPSNRISGSRERFQLLIGNQLEVEKPRSIRETGHEAANFSSYHWSACLSSAYELPVYKLFVIRRAFHFVLFNLYLEQR